MDAAGHRTSGPIGKRNECPTHNLCTPPAATSASGCRLDGKGQLAKSNADQVSRIRTILEALSLEVATPKEARAMLNLKGGDQVGF